MACAGGPGRRREGAAGDEHEGTAAIARDPLGVEQRPRVADRGDDERDDHAGDGDDAADVEEAEGPEPEGGDHRPPGQGDDADGEEDAQLGRADAEEGHLEDAADVGGEVDLGGDEQVGREDAEGDERGHETGGAETAEEHRRAGEVDDVIDVEAEPWPLLLADPGERPVETVTEPVDRERQHDPDQADHPILRRPEAEAGAGHRRQTEATQVIGRDPAGQPLGHVDESATFGPCQGAAVGPHVVDQLLPHRMSSIV